MRAVKAKMLRRMAEAMANPKYTERMYTVRKAQYKKLVAGKEIIVDRVTHVNAKDSMRGIYRRLKKGAAL